MRRDGEVEEKWRGAVERWRRGDEGWRGEIERNRQGEMTEIMRELLFPGAGRAD
jgi:hypothetical protein